MDKASSVPAGAAARFGAKSSCDDESLLLLVENKRKDKLLDW